MDDLTSSCGVGQPRPRADSAYTTLPPMRTRDTTERRASIVWIRPLVSRSARPPGQAGEGIASVSDGQLFLRTASFLWAIGERTGT
jgi:hypothetical protein